MDKFYKTKTTTISNLIRETWFNPTTGLIIDLSDSVIKMYNYSKVNELSINPADLETKTFREVIMPCKGKGKGGKKGGKK